MVGVFADVNITTRSTIILLLENHTVCRRWRRVVVGMFAERDGC